MAPVRLSITQRRYAWRGNGQTVWYDNNGSVESDGQGTYTCDKRNQMVSATVSGAATTYGYDTDEWRFVKRNRTETTYYVRALLDSCFQRSRL
jgi:hypothetical protein